MNKNKFLLAGACLIMFGQVIVAQSNLPDEKVEIIKDYRANIDKVNSIILHPSIPDKDAEGKYNYEYVVGPSNVELAYEPPKLKPIPYYHDLLPKSYNVFLKGGYGTPHSPIFDGSLHWRNDDENLGIHLNGSHHSANKKSLQHQRFSKSGIDFKADYSTSSDLLITGGFSYRVQDAYLYGYDHAVESYEEIDVKRNLNRTKVHLAFENSPTLVQTIRYGVGGRFNKLNDDLGYGETDFLLNAFASKEMTDDVELGAKVEGRFINSELSILTDLTNVQFRPYVQLHRGIFNLQAGINIASNRGVKVLPDVTLEAAIPNVDLAVLAGWNGGLRSNSVSELLERNAYLEPNLSELISTEYNEIYGGMRGSYKGLQIEAKLGYESVEQFPVYLSNAEDPRLFDVLYDDGHILRGSINLVKPILQRGSIYGNVLYNRYNLDEQAYAWHHASTQIELGASWNIFKETLTVKGFTTVQSGMPTRDAQGEFLRLNSLTDVSIHADYFATEKIGVFGQVNNILNRNHEQWLNYPSYGLNVYGGIMVRF